MRVDTAKAKEGGDEVWPKLQCLEDERRGVGDVERYQEMAKRLTKTRNIVRNSRPSSALQHGFVDANSSDCELERDDDWVSKTERERK